MAKLFNYFSFYDITQFKRDETVYYIKRLIKLYAAIYLKLL